MTFQDYETEPIECIGCKQGMDGHLATREGQAPPREGDLAICAECSTLCVYVEVDEKMAFRAPTDDELKEFMADPKVLRAIAMLTTARARASFKDY